MVIIAWSCVQKLATDAFVDPDGAADTMHISTYRVT